MDYGDSRVCKTLAGQFESDASHKNMLSSSKGRTLVFLVDAGSTPVDSTKGFNGEYSVRFGFVWNCVVRVHVKHMAANRRRPLVGFDSPQVHNGLTSGVGTGVLM